MEEASFRVVASVQYKNKMLCFVFSLHSGRWHGFEFDSWRTLVVADTSSSYGTRYLCQRHYAHGCFYWMLDAMDKLLILDTHKMEVSITSLSVCEYESYFTISEAEEGSVGFFNLRRDSSGEFHLCYTIRGIKPEGANGLQLDLDKTISLPLHYNHGIAGAAEGYIILQRCPDKWSEASFQDGPEHEFFSLELKTMQLVRVYTLKSLIIHPVIHIGFPPSLSPSSM